jgi:hypothetical protein
LHIADFNGDGKLDIFVTDTHNVDSKFLGEKMTRIFYQMQRDSVGLNPLKHISLDIRLETAEG